MNGLKGLLVLGPDSGLRDVFSLAQEAHAGRRVDALHVPSRDYYFFELGALDNYPSDAWDVCLAVNEFYINDVRRALRELVVARGYQLVGAISPNARIDPSVSMGENVVVHSGCFVGAGSQVGDLAVLRPNVVLSEDVFIGRFVTLEANVSVREGSVIGNFTTICANSSLARMTRVGEHCYLNIPKLYSGEIASGTFYSGMFENPVRVLLGTQPIE